MWKVDSIQEDLFTHLLDCKPWFDMALDACMIMYFSLHLILCFWVFALSGSVLSCFIHVLNVCFKFWVGQSTKKWFYPYFNKFENKNCFKLHKIPGFIKWYFCHYVPRSSGLDNYSFWSYFSSVIGYELMKFALRKDFKCNIYIYIYRERERERNSKITN